MADVMQVAQGAAQGAAQGVPPGGGQMPQGGSFPQGGPPSASGGMGILPGGPVASIVIVALLVITLIVLAIAFYRLYQKAGFAGALGLFMLVPIVNLGVALYLAFAEWPVLAELVRMKLLAASAASPPTAADAPASSPVAEPAAPFGA